MESRLEAENIRLKKQVEGLQAQIRKLQEVKRQSNITAKNDKTYFRYQASDGRCMRLYKKAYDGIMKAKGIEITAILELWDGIRIEYLTEAGQQGEMKLNNMIDKLNGGM